VLSLLSKIFHEGPGGRPYLIENNYHFVSTTEIIKERLHNGHSFGILFNAAKIQDLAVLREWAGVARLRRRVL
jgi:hypothetical protein